MERQVLGVASVALACAAGLAVAQPAYPNKPVRLVVGFAPGGSVDVLGRLFAQRFAQTMGQPFIVDNRPGAAANIAGDIVAKSPADGYTLLVGNAGGLGGNLAIYRRMPYDPFRDFTPIAQMVTQGNILIVHPSVPAKTVKEFIAIARRRAGRSTLAPPAMARPSTSHSPCSTRSRRSRWSMSPTRAVPPRWPT